MDDKNDDFQAGAAALEKLIEALRLSDHSALADLMVSNEIDLAISWGRVFIPDEFQRMEALIEQISRANDAKIVEVSAA